MKVHVQALPVIGDNCLLNVLLCCHTLTRTTSWDLLSHIMQLWSTFVIIRTGAMMCSQRCSCTIFYKKKLDNRLWCTVCLQAKCHPVRVCMYSNTGCIYNTFTVNVELPNKNAYSLVNCSVVNRQLFTEHKQIKLYLA